MSDVESYDSILKEAFIEYQKREVDALWEEFSKAESHVFSERFENRMTKLVKFSERPYFRFVNTFAKRAAVFAIIITIPLSAAFSVEAIREPVIQFFIEVYEKFTHIVFQTDAGNSENNANENSSGDSLSGAFPVIIEDVYEPTVLPDGYTFTNNINMSIFYQNTYSNQNGEDISFDQFTITSIDLNIDTEDGAIVEEIMLKNTKALFAQNKGTNFLVWNDNKYGYKIVGTIEKDSMIKMALSLGNHKQLNNMSKKIK